MHSSQHCFSFQEEVNNLNTNLFWYYFDSDPTTRNCSPKPILETNQVLIFFYFMENQPIRTMQSCYIVDCIHKLCNSMSHCSLMQLWQLGVSHSNLSQGKILMYCFLMVSVMCFIKKICILPQKGIFFKNPPPPPPPPDPSRNSNLTWYISFNILVLEKPHPPGNPTLLWGMYWYLLELQQWRFYTITMICFPPPHPPQERFGNLCKYIIQSRVCATNINWVCVIQA